MGKKVLKKVSEGTNVEEYLNKSNSSPFPQDIQPMLATLVDKATDELGWQYEIKWDGYRAIAYAVRGRKMAPTFHKKTPASLMYRQEFQK